MGNQPKLLDASRMRDIFTPHMSQMGDSVYLSRELGMIHGNPAVFRLMVSQKPPFIINDHRMGVITRGEGEVNLNLVDRHLTAGTLMYLGPGTIINPIRIAGDLEIQGVALFADFPMPFATGPVLPAFNGQVRDFQIQADAAEVQTALHILDTLWHVVHQPHCHQATVTSLVWALMNHYDGLFLRQADTQSRSRSREQAVFDRFILLVNQECSSQHQLGYYAQRLCLTQRYLSTVIRQASGTPAKEWIDRALVTRIKVELRHSDKSAAQIADELHFANPSFFSKYFKRLTGMTPSEYRGQ